MRAVVVRCPHCNANLEVASTVTSTTCSYCGTVSRIQARTAMFQIPKKADIPPPSAQMTRQQIEQFHKMPVARQKVSPLLVVVPMLVVLAMIGGGIFFAARAIRGGLGGIGGSKMMWAGHQPLLVEIDGDGTLDLVGITRYVQKNDTAHYGAFSGKTGEALWETEPIGNYTAISQDHLGISGNLILVASKSGSLVARDAKAKGNVVWQTSFGEKIEILCAAPNGEFSVGTADKKWYLVDAKGAKREGPKLLRLDHDYTNDHARAMFDRAGTEAARDICAPILAGRGVFPGTVMMRSWKELANVPNMRVEHLAKRFGGPTIAHGHKQPGTAVPMLARLEPVPTPAPTEAPDKSGRHRGVHKESLPGATWTVEVPAVDPLNSRLSPEHITISDKAVFALYEGSSKHRLTAFDLATGKRLWDRDIPHGSGFVVVGLSLTGDVVMITTWQNVLAYGVADGADRFKIGGTW